MKGEEKGKVWRRESLNLGLSEGWSKRVGLLFLWLSFLRDFTKSVCEKEDYLPMMPNHTLSLLVVLSHTEQSGGEEKG